MRRRGLLLLSFVTFGLAGCGAIPETRESARPQARAAPQTPHVARPEMQQCTAELGRTGSQFAPLPDKFYGGGCQATNAVRIDQLAGDDGRFDVSNLGPVSCPLANTFAAWARYGVDRAARQILGSPLVRIETMGSYSCRNVAGSGRLSAHSRAEAIDVAAFVLADGRRISVTGGWDDASREEERFLRTVHNSACKRFGTVLGPDYNAAHRDHFHLEFGTGSYCR